MDDIFKALSDQTRRDILTMTSDAERRAGDIALAFGMSRPAVSQHLGVLADSGLLTMRRNGRERLYTTNRDKLDEARQWLNAFWSARLGLLKVMAEAEQRKQDAKAPRPAKPTASKNPRKKP